MNNFFKEYNFSTIFSDPRLTGVYQYTRNVGGYNTDGDWQGKVITGEFKGIVEPSSQADIEMLPQAEKITDAINIISDTELFISEGDHLADVVDYRGHDYKITEEKEFNWNAFYYIATRLDNK